MGPQTHLEAMKVSYNAIAQLTTGIAAELRRQEARLRRDASRKGYRLRKLRSRTRTAYMIIDAATGIPEFDSYHTFNDVQAWLECRP
jgi:hypothetical protein